MLFKLKVGLGTATLRSTPGRETGSAGGHPYVRRTAYVAAKVVLRAGPLTSVW